MPVPMPMVQIGVVRMPMHHRLMTMRVCMRIMRIDTRCMLVSMVLVVTMPVFMLQHLVLMLVLVPLG